jgi:hypothetical protein
MKWSALAQLSLIAPFAHALLRFPCSQLVTQRFDPLVTPGKISPHVHQIIGGNAFNLTMNANNDLPALSTCTTCRFKEDFSNYWTAVLYFKHRNGSFLRVPQFANQFTGSPNGGMTVYYIQPGVTNPNKEKVTTFPKGFRMIVGNPMIRNKNGIDANSPEGRTSTFRCWGANYQSDASWPHPGTGPLDTVELPKGKCAGGIRSNVFFPSCWNGKDLDPADHASHMKYPTGTVPRDGLFWFAGTCPTSHPIRMPLLFYEIAWDTRSFNSMEWPTDGSQPFVFSMGDPTGFGQHGDYVFGWQGDSLQRAMDQCTDAGGQPEGCGALTVQNDQSINRCVQQAQVNEGVEGRYLSALPGCNPIQKGPASATLVPESQCTALSTTGGVPAGPTPTQPVPTPTQPVPTQPPNPQQPTIPKYGQCGGNGWTGGTVCAPGSSCVKQNDFYSQCL